MHFSVILVAFLFSGVNSIKITKCMGSNKPVPYKVIIDDCDDDSLCTFEIGQKFVCEYEWIASQDSHKLRRTVTIIDGTTYKQVLNEGGACDHTDKCPVKKDATVSFKETDEVSKDTPRGKKSVQVKMFDGDTNKELFCFCYDAMFI